ncbi:MAG: dienelactone hydrolase family protein [Armatimonadota bacterium]|nr:S9 family peptidase [bacterium]
MEVELEITLKEIKVKQTGEDLYEVGFITSRGTNKGILHHRDENTAATILIGGTGGGFNGPSSIFKDLGTDLLGHDISSLRLDYRKAAHLEECVLDVLMAMEFLEELGIDRVGLVGWSFGGAVVIQAGIASEMVRTVATIASQSYGTRGVENLSPKALLLIHGTDDQTLPYSSSQDIYNRANEPKEIVLYERANHGIDQNRDQMLARIRDFLVMHLEEEE